MKKASLLLVIILTGCSNAPSTTDAEYALSKICSGIKNITAIVNEDEVAAKTFSMSFNIDDKELKVYLLYFRKNNVWKLQDSGVNNLPGVKCLTEWHITKA